MEKGTTNGGSHHQHRMPSATTVAVCGVLVALVLYVLWLQRRRGGADGPAPSGPSAPPPPVRSGVAAMAALLPRAGMDTVGNLLSWQMEMSRIDGILKEVGGGGGIPPPAAARPCAAAAPRPRAGAYPAAPLITPEEAQLLTEAMEARRRGSPSPGPARDGPGPPAAPPG